MVRCVDCGFLSLQDPRTGEFREAEDEFRRSGELPRFQSPHDGDWYLCMVVKCVALAHNLMEEIDGARTSTGEGTIDALKRVALDVVSADRECGYFVRWEQGFSPKEHREMQRESEIMKFQEEQREKDHAWQTATKEADRKAREEDKLVDRQYNESQRRIDGDIAFRRQLIIATISLLGGAVIGYLFKKEEPRQPPPPIVIQMDGKEIKVKPSE